MTTATARRSLATLVIVACMTVGTGVAFVVMSYAKWNWLSVVLGGAMAVLLVICVGVLISALEDWLDRAEEEPDEAERRS